MNLLLFTQIIKEYWSDRASNYFIIVINFTFILMRAPFALLENIFLGSQIKNTRINHDPIFILGYYRSGTTHLQKLLSLNTQLSYLNIFKTYFPDSFLLLESWFKPLTQLFLNLFKIQNPIHRIGFNWDLPGEEDIAFVFYPYRSSLNWLHGFPSKAELAVQNGILQNEKGKNEWKKNYLNYIRKLTYNFKGRQLVLKSPPNTARIKEILELFPNAKFIHIERDEVETLKSNRYLWDVVKDAQYEEISSLERDEIILKLRNEFKYQYEKTKGFIPSGSLIELKFESLLENPFEVLKDIYKNFDLSFNNEDQVILATYLREKHGKHRGNYKANDSDIELLDRFQDYNSIKFSK